MQLCFKYKSAGKCRRKFQCQFPGQTICSKQSIHTLVSKLKITGSLLDKKPDSKMNGADRKKMDDICARLETSPTTCLKRLAEETGV
jgi:hypothetical protein